MDNGVSCQVATKNLSLFGPMARQGTLPSIKPGNVNGGSRSMVLESGWMLKRNLLILLLPHLRPFPKLFCNPYYKRPT
jgi:hypothetical protein